MVSALMDHNIFHRDCLKEKSVGVCENFWKWLFTLHVARGWASAGLLGLVYATD